jgi:hypothetical protein
VEKATGVIWQRRPYKAITYKEERKTFSELVRKHRTRYSSPGDQGKGDKIARWEPTEKGKGDGEGRGGGEEER